MENQSVENLISLNDLLLSEFKEDPSLASKILKEEIEEYYETKDLSYVLDTLSRIIVLKGYDDFEKEGLNRATIYGMLKSKIPADLNVINKILKILGEKEIIS